MTVALIVALAGCVYSYAIYPILLLAMPVRTRRRADSAHTRGCADSTEMPSITLVITAHNEEKTIRSKIENSLAIKLDHKFDIVVASDGSSDGTDDIVRTYASQGVRLVRADQRLGKEYAQLCALREVDDGIVVFSDVATRLEPDSLQHVLAAFCDSAVGAVSSEDRFLTESGSVVGEGLYVRYEMWLRRLESERGGLVGLSGSFFAVRRDVCNHWDIASPSDFNTALSCARLGYVAVSDASVVGIYRDIADPGREYQRKVRTVIRGITGLVRHPEALSLRNARFAFQVFSHKLMRWLVPWFMLASLVLNGLVADQNIWLTALFVCQLGFYGACVILHFIPPLRRLGLLRLVYFFVQVNLAVFHAGLKVATGTRITVWTPSER